MGFRCKRANGTYYQAKWKLVSAGNQAGAATAYVPAITVCQQSL